MVFLYRVGISLYSGAIYIASFFYTKAKLFREGRQNWQSRLREYLQKNSFKEVAWFHVSSLGEFEQARPLIEMFRKSYPCYKIVLTFFSPSGYEVRKNYEKADLITYLPLDSPQNAEEFIEIIKPTIVFFTKYDFWYFYLKALYEKQIPLICFSATFRPNQVFFQWYGTFFRRMLRFFSIILVQNEDSLKLLFSIEIKHAAICGDTRFDRVVEIFQRRTEIPKIKEFVKNTPTLVVGSSWKEDIELLADAFKDWYKPIKIIIAPHELSEKNYRFIETSFSDFKIEYYSKLSDTNATILIIDNIGMLSSLYQYGQFAYVGGAFGKGLHNILEAAVYGIPIFFGNKNFTKFQEAIRLLQAGGAFVVADYIEFRKLFREMYKNEGFRQSAGKVSYDFVRYHTGATSRILSYVEQYLKDCEKVSFSEKK
ncbi:MAG: 3-deoxy-D-manno-octulosonic acid transferase [Cytophagales bacterium]|nr:3-deoxy-D-manno-octulosonic acid transferase [Cytophagales bacterium]MDW8385186.1 glycosyltransferase N-terminal domain-containing protein [Flammeovirgaceae bacterium]